jgi:tellurite resistance protein TehA-like permease
MVRTPRPPHGALAGPAGQVVPGSFAMVMATGIVAAALRLDRAALAADVLLVLAAAAFVLLAAAIGWRAVATPAILRADLTSASRAFAAFTFTAACNVLCLGLAAARLATGADLLAAAGAAAWLALTAVIPVRLAISRRARPAIAEVNGTWYLWTVATQSLAIMAAVVHAGGALAARPAAAVALAAWLTGVAAYLLTSALVAVRLLRAGVGQRGARASYWVAMGAASISVLAATHVLGIRGAPAVTAARPWITAVAIALWALATCLIPVLAVATVLLRSLPRPRYDPAAWMVVFPLGMYATASQQLGASAGLHAMGLVGGALTWPAAAAWLAVLVAMAAAPLRSGTVHPGLAGSSSD